MAMKKRKWFLVLAELTPASVYAYAFWFSNIHFGYHKSLYWVVNDRFFLGGATMFWLYLVSSGTTSLLLYALPSKLLKRDFPMRHWFLEYFVALPVVAGIVTFAVLLPVNLCLGR